MLDVPVESSWKACSFASPPFETTLKKLEDIFQLETPIKSESHKSTSTSSKISSLETEDNFQTTISRKLE